MSVWKGRSPMRKCIAAMSRRESVRGIWSLKGGDGGDRVVEADEGEEKAPVFVSRVRGRKLKTFFKCNVCERSEPVWWGFCASCKNTNTFEPRSERPPPIGGGASAMAESMLRTIPASSSLEALKSSSSINNGDDNDDDDDDDDTMRPPRSWIHPSVSSAHPRSLGDISRDNPESRSRRLMLSGDTGSELSRVLGGGLVPGSLILLGGDPGVGKSTLLLQVAGLLADRPEFGKAAPVLYVSGEESVEQISARAVRLKILCHELFLYSVTDLEAISKAIQQLSPRAVVIDSIQTLYLPSMKGNAGSVNQVKECASFLLRVAKKFQISIFLIGHLTKTGVVAGPRVLEHLVDVVLYMEGEISMSHRILRVAKNRYGSTNEIGIFEMVEGGLVAVANPSQLFLSERTNDFETSVSAAIAVIMKGSRPFLVEIQALSSDYSKDPQLVAHGVDAHRLSTILAVLMKFSKSYDEKVPSKLSSQDLFINVVGGMKIKESAADLAIAVAILSSCLDRVVPNDMVFVGEIGLAGELRPVKNLEKRIIESLKLGFKRCVVPGTGKKSVMDLTKDGIEIYSCSNVMEVLNRIFPSL